MFQWVTWSQKINELARQLLSLGTSLPSRLEVVIVAAFKKATRQWGNARFDFWFAPVSEIVMCLFLRWIRFYTSCTIICSEEAFCPTAQDKMAIEGKERWLGGHSQLRERYLPRMKWSTAGRLHCLACAGEGKTVLLVHSKKTQVTVAFLAG